MLFTSNKMTCKEKMIKLNALLLLISPKNNVIKCLNFGHIIWVLIVQLWGGGLNVVHPSSSPCGVAASSA